MIGGVALLLVISVPVVLLLRRQAIPHDGRNPVDLGAAIARLALHGRGITAERD